MKYNAILLFALTNMCVTAQIRPNKDPNEISIHIGGGLSSFHHIHAPNVDFLNGYAVDFGIGYTYYFHQNWGLFFGVVPEIFNTKQNINLDVLTPHLTDKNGYIFDLYTKANYNESFQTIFLNIPVMLQFQTKQKKVQSWNRSQKRYKCFYVMGGIKAGIPLKDRYKSGITTITNAAYYPELNNWAATQRFAGLGTFDDGSRNDGNLNLKTPCLRVAFEAGFKWRFKTNYLLYTGAYCDFGLNTTANSVRTPLHNHIAVDHITDFTLLTFSDRLNIMTAGVVVRLAYFRLVQNVFCPYIKEPVKKY